MATTLTLQSAELIGDDMNFMFSDKSLETYFGYDASQIGLGDDQVLDLLKLALVKIYSMTSIAPLTLVLDLENPEGIILRIQQ